MNLEAFTPSFFFSQAKQLFMGFLHADEVQRAFGFFMSLVAGATNEWTASVELSSPGCGDLEVLCRYLDQSCRRISKKWGLTWFYIV